MSIKPHLADLVKRGLLQPFVLKHPRCEKRALYFTPDVDKEITSTSSAVNFHGARADCVRAMERWVAGDGVDMSLSGPGRETLLARLDSPPADVWEIRVTEPKVHFRIFCQFASRDVLIATHIRTRSSLGAKHRASGVRSKEWTSAMHACRAACQKLLPPHVALSGDDPSLFVSEKYHVI